MGKIFPDVYQTYEFNPEIESMLKPLTQLFDITYMDRTIRGNSKFLYFFLKPEDHTKQSFGFDRELLCIYFTYEDLFSRTFEIINELLIEYNVRLDQMVCVFISQSEKIPKEIKEFTIRDPERICIIPFWKNYLQNEKPHSTDLKNHFREHMYNRDLFAIESPIQSDRAFFGRDDIVIQFVDRIKNKQNSGIFGLRKTGKTSVLYAIQRYINNKQMGSMIYLDCSNPAFYKNEWWKCLKYILKSIIIEFNLQDQIDISEIEFNCQNTSHLFTTKINEIIQLVPEKRLVLALDEIEWISFKTSSEKHWNQDFLPFWQTLRAIHQTTNGDFTFIIAGVNPKCVEDESVGGYDNPLFALIKPFFLKPFDEKSVRTMLRTLGRYMGIKFEISFYNKLIESYGGHPFLVRHACSKIAEIYKERPVEITDKDFEKNKTQINLSLQKYIKQILNVLAVWYPDEYEMVILLSKGKYDKVQEHMKVQPEFLEHLLGYGLVSIIEGKPKLSLLILSSHLRHEKQITEISEIETGEPEEIEQIQEEISRKRNKLENSLRELIRAGMKFKYGNKSMSQILKSIEEKRREILSRFSYEVVFRELYFNELVSIIEKNWEAFKNWFSCDLDDVIKWLTMINKFRIDAHAKEIDSEDLAYLRICFKRMDEALSFKGV